jgi:Fur family ferric uptake transcriptional regulator
MKQKTPFERNPSEQLAQRLRQESRKITGPRRAILELLQGKEHPLAIGEIHKSLPKNRCDLATVYRSMRMLEEMALVQRFDFGDGIARFELVREQEDGHHHHLICKECAKVVEIEECFPPDFEERIAAGNGFARITHKLEFFGVCPGCQNKEL